MNRARKEVERKRKEVEHFEWLRRAYHVPMDDELARMHARRQLRAGMLERMETDPTDIVAREWWTDMARLKELDQLSVEETAMLFQVFEREACTAAKCSPCAAERYFKALAAIEMSMRAMASRAIKGAA